MEFAGTPTNLSGYDFIEKLRLQALHFGAVFQTAQVIALRKEKADDTAGGGRFLLDIADGAQLSARSVILAAGAKHRLLGVPGEKEFTGSGVSYCAPCDGPFFKKKKIFVVGGGDTACDEARYLSRFSPTVVLIHRRDQLRAQKALVERVRKNPNIQIRLNTTIQEIRGKEKVSSVILRDTITGIEHDEAADAVFIFTGIQAENALVSSGELDSLVKKDESGFIITGSRMETSLPGLFAAGDIRNSPFRQVITACADGAIAAHSAGQYIEAGI